MHQSLSVDTIIESCLILMVLLLLTCARHLVVDCTALKSPIYLLTISSRGHQVVLCLPNCPPRHPFLNCLPSVTRSVTSPVILPSVCKSWLFVLKHVNLVEVCHLSSPLPLKKTNKKNTSVGWRVPVDPHIGCFLTFSPPPPSSAPPPSR